MDQWPASMRGELGRREPENVNSSEPPSYLLRRLHGGDYQKVYHANRILRNAATDPEVAISRCPNLKKLSDDLLLLARILRKH